MYTLRIIETITDPGSQERANEDRAGFNAASAFVIDGATGLSPDRVMTAYASDAAWLAERSEELLTRNLVGDASPSPVLRSVMETLRAEFMRETDGHPIPRYAFPSASIVLVHLHEDTLMLCGLGDCIAYVRDRNGIIQIFSALRGFAAAESEGARAHIRRAGGLRKSGSLLSDQSTLDHLRDQRSLQNTEESGVWTLGLEPKAAQHLAFQRIAASGHSDILLCSDGFSALADAYGMLTPKELMETARADGLSGLLATLRHTERVEDPDGQLYPRYKRSDDATAIFLHVAED